MQGEGETDAEYTARIQSFADNITDLFAKLDQRSLESAMYAANAEGLLLGIRGRLSQANALRARRRSRFRARMNP